MVNEETIIQELKKCYYREDEEETAEKERFLREAIVMKVADLFGEKEKIFWCGHEKNLNIWAATPVKSPASLKLFELFGPSDARFIFLTEKQAVYIHIMRLLEEAHRSCYKVAAIHSILCGYYWTRKRGEFSSRAVRIIVEGQSDFHASVTLSDASYHELVGKIQTRSACPLTEKVILLDDSDSIKRYYSRSIRRKSS